MSSSNRSVRALVEVHERDTIPNISIALFSTRIHGTSRNGQGWLFGPSLVACSSRTKSLSPDSRISRGFDRHRVATARQLTIDRIVINNSVDSPALPSENPIQITAAQRISRGRCRGLRVFTRYLGGINRLPTIAWRNGARARAASGKE